MLPQNIIEIIQKYDYSDNDIINKIDKNISEILSSLNTINEHIANNLKQLVIDKKLEEASIVIGDSAQLVSYINSIQAITYQNIEKSIEDIDFSKELSLTFDETIHPYIVTDDICPDCNVKFNFHTIHYQMIENNKIVNKNLSGYKCPVCNNLFVIDYEIGNILTDNTNITYDTKYYNKILFHDAIVIFNNNKCFAHNHKTKDIIGNIPVIMRDGIIEYKSVPMIYCETCKRYILLKSDYDKLNGILACITIDESNTDISFGENNFYYGDKNGSKLSQYGYNVNCTDKLTVEQRHTILSMQLLSGNITKGEIYSILDTNIQNGIHREGTKKEWTNAIPKWKSDRDYVRNFNMEQENEYINISRLILKYSVKSK